MSLDSSILIAGSGLRSVTKQISVVSQNVANASTPGYAAETANASSLTAGGVGSGVSTAPTSRDVDQALEASVFAQNGEVAAQQTTANALAQIDATQGTPGAGDDLASEVGALTDAFTALDASPDQQADQSAVVNAANTLAAGINTVANAYQAGRQSAQNAIVTDVSTLNTTLGQIGALSKQIVEGKAQGQSTADLENQRDAAEQTAAQLAGVQFLPQSNGDVVALVGGSQVNLQATTGPFAISSATMSADSTGPVLTLSGQDITASVTSGSIGANLTLRDKTLPAGQAGLDEFAKTLANRLGDQGLQLFTDPAGNVPAGGGTPTQTGYVGFANIIQVNPAVTATPSLVRDGTNAVAAGIGGAAGFTPNPSGGPVGFTTLISNILAYAFGPNAQQGTTQPTPATTGLGVSGDQSLSYQPSGTIAGFAANLVGAQSLAVSNANDALTTGQSLQTTLSSKLQSESGVSLDSELSNLIVLQNAYGANAKVMTAAQSMWTDLFTAVTVQP
jgi:flagellar hook-associated protein 1 FlgK